MRGRGGVVVVVVVVHIYDAYSRAARNHESLVDTPINAF